MGPWAHGLMPMAPWGYMSTYRQMTEHHRQSRHNLLSLELEQRRKQTNERGLVAGRVWILYLSAGQPLYLITGLIAGPVGLTEADARSLV